MTHNIINPAIHYWGTPVVLITTTNEDGTPNIGPISSAFWLGNRCMLGLENNSQTTINLRRSRQCVLNLPSDDMITQVNALTRTTGTLVGPQVKIALGYRYVKDKFGTATLTPEESGIVTPPRIKECDAKGFTLAIEVSVLRTYVFDELRLAGHANRIDPDVWRPMILKFPAIVWAEGRKERKVHLANIEEELYRLPED
ncbi:hypothetical protein MMC08_004950 [Hypocenomyce scalaris]|nr:hypothetical protein [Hypocenomyce scalaris]